MYLCAQLCLSLEFMGTLYTQQRLPRSGTVWASFTRGIIAPCRRKEPWVSTAASALREPGVVWGFLVQLCFLPSVC